MLVSGCECGYVYVFLELFYQNGIEDSMALECNLI